MKSVNLIPAPRRAAKRRSVQVRRCAAFCVTWAVLSGLAAAGSHALWRDLEGDQAEDRYATVSEDIQRTERAISDVRARLAAAESTLRAHEAIANQPDWSILLALLGQAIRDDVVLKECRVHPAGGAGSNRADARRALLAAPPTAGQAGAGEAAPFVLELSGMAKSYEAANRFLRELEETKLFKQVTLLDTAREQFLVGMAVAFRLQCSLDEPGDGSAAGTGAAAVAAPAHATVDQR